ncbi:multiubiquitin domain-containing protein [Marinifilum flexuosum]|uniref:multiubiquitin domain-containing protein n=1 Tax=Marinifilum flexuosum TaxID=1117708 RepID=UPI00248F917E|nr:multiubiquitin domain-containing protein [Marinifilum flexuosum]
MNSYFTIKVGKDDQYYFNLKAGNHEIILQSEGYENKSGTLNGIESVRLNSQIRSNFEIRYSKRNEPYFVLKAPNGKIIGCSEMYSSVHAMENGIHSVMKNGNTPKIHDLTDDDHEGKERQIVVNGRVKTWNQKYIEFKELVELAFGSYNDNPNTCYTITYTRGCSNKPQGSIVKGEEVKVKPKMIFNVTATDKS